MPEWYGVKSEDQLSLRRKGEDFTPYHDNSILLVAMRLGETPVHISNTMVKA